MTATLSLTSRELKRFYRQRSRIIGSLATPLVFWILLGTGLTAAFPSANGEGSKGFIGFFYPANLIMTLLFTSIFSTISIIEDRHQGFLQSVLVAPVGSFGIVAGKVFGGASIAVFQGCLFLLLAPFAGFHLTPLTILQAVISMAAMGLTMTAIGFLFAWKIDSVQGFHSIMNLVLFPMWLMSGAFFPISSVPQWLQFLMKLNPLTFGVSALSAAFYGEQTLRSPYPFTVSVLACFLYGAAFFLFSMKVVSRGRTQ